MSATPGPWSVDKRRPFQVVAPERPGFNGGAYRIADAYFSTAGLVNTPRIDEAQANARLIAAAWDYDAAARNLARYKDAGEKIPETAWQQLYDAIAKATTP